MPHEGRLLVGKLSLGQLGRGGGASPATARISYTAQVSIPAWVLAVKDCSWSVVRIYTHACAPVFATLAQHRVPLGAYILPERSTDGQGVSVEKPARKWSPLDRVPTQRPAPLSRHPCLTLPCLALPCLVLALACVYLMALLPLAALPWNARPSADQDLAACMLPCIHAAPARECQRRQGRKG